MAGRGWGRRGGGRGGRSSAGIVPTAVDDEGNKLTEMIKGPPPDFPEVKDLPHPLPILDRHERLLDRWHRLRHTARAGPYFIEDRRQAKDAGKFSGDGHPSDGKPKKARDRLALSAIVTLSPYYFPSELSSDKDKRAAQRHAKSSRALEAFWRNQSMEDNEFEKFEELAAKGEQGEKGAEDEENEGDEIEEEESDEGDEGDDYVVGPEFDDDDGYEESDDGGMDEGVY